MPAPFPADSVSGTRLVALYPKTSILRKLGDGPFCTGPFCTRRPSPDGEEEVTLRFETCFDDMLVELRLHANAATVKTLPKSYMVELVKFGTRSRKQG